MSKPNNIRKKALDHAKKGQWDKALVEFTRLVEVELHNPNLFNEIGDIQLKLGNKHEAFKRYHEAIDAYAKVGLHNNAVAVCKKILRLNPNDDAVYAKMALLRKGQGFEREAVDYSLTFLDKNLGGPDASNGNVRGLVMQLVATFEAVPNVLERAAEFLLKDGQDADAGRVLEKLGELYRARGMTAENERMRDRMKSIGYVPSPAAADAAPAPEKLETVESHREGHPVDHDVAFNGTVPPHIRRGRDGNAASDFGVIDVGAARPTKPPEQVRGSGAHENVSLPGGGEPRGVRESEADPPNHVEEDEWLRSRSPRAPDATHRHAAARDEPKDNLREYVIPEPEKPAGTSGEETGGGFLSGEESKDAAAEQDLAAELASQVKADVDDGDYRSHYDLGMAYLEMALFADAIREFQFASNSPTYQLRSLEMIGRCLINQGQPKLAIKQLARGLELVKGDDRGALGIKYNLALAYEMVDEPDMAKALFEDVYVVDITFRDVQERVKKYAS